ncbi:S1C family serine protease, partial [bacterium]|nr:S1C family serine protease [bacterium]
MNVDADGELNCDDIAFLFADEKPGGARFHRGHLLRREPSRRLMPRMPNSMKNRSPVAALRLTVFATLLASIFLLSGCFSVRTSTGGRPGAGDERDPTGRAVSEARGLGASAPGKPWVDGTAGPGDATQSLTSETYVRVAESANPAVVNIFTTMELSVGIGDPLGIFSVPVGEEGSFQATSLGTGFFIHPDGYLVTNAHVVAKADNVYVFLHDRSQAREVRVVGIDPITDLALLHVATSDPVPYLALADSDEVRIGDIVVAIGNPFGLDYSMTTGIISAKNRVLSVGSRRGLYEDFLQTSAQINPDADGQLHRG